MSILTKETAQVAARWLARGRMGLGVGALALPTLLARPWVGRPADLVPLRVLSRALGARDLALGLGVVLAQRHDAPVRGWVEGGGLADAGDLAATLLAWRSLPRLGRWAILALTAAGVGASRVVSASLEDK